MENESVKTNFFSSRSFKIIAIILGLILIGFGAYQVIGGLKSKVSSAFINKFNEINNLSGDIGRDMKAASDLLLGIAAKEQAKDYSGAAKDVEESISDLNNAVSKINSLNTDISEFKAMVEAVSDANVKQSGLKLTGLLEQRSTTTLKLISDSKKLVEPAKAYYEALAASKAGVYLSNSQVAELTQEINKDNEILTALAAQFDAANQALADTAGFKLTKAK